MKNFKISFKVVLIFSLFIFTFISSHQTQHVFYYVTDLTDFDWESDPISCTNEEHLIPNNYIAWSLYSNTINETGFAQLEVHTNAEYFDSLQAYHAGFIEGYITAELIGMHWRNQIELYCNNQQNYCKKLIKFLEINLNVTQNKVKSLRHKSSYWHQIGLVLEQYTGLQDGYNFKVYDRKPGKPRIEIDFQGVVWLNLIPEFGDLQPALNQTNENIIIDGSHSCSAFVKPLEDGSDLYVAHDTWVWYSMMLRIVKKYELNYHRFENCSQDFIPGRTASFSSYPGAITSIDDYYILSSGLVVMETSITNSNNNLWKYIKPKKIVLEFIRNLVANRLATSGKEWTELFAEYNSGTYNNEWMIIDYNKFTAGTHPQNLSDDLLWVLEQMPGHVKSADVTHVLRKQGYWASYNVPYFPEIFEISGYDQLVELYGDYYTHDNTARAKIFRRDHVNVKDLASIYRLMRYNDFKNDPLSKCNCTPPYTAEYAIAARDDLNDPSGKYGFAAIAFRDWGAIDTKITTANMTKCLEMLIVSSPSYEKQPPFQWSNTLLPKDTRHEGLPDKWTFLPYFLRWYPFEDVVACDVID